MPTEALPTVPGYRQLVVLVSVLLSVAVVALLRSRERDFVAALRTRFLLGIPWGTALTIGFVVSIYLFVQGGLAHPTDPLVIPFRAWSYYYPLGMLAAGFSHASQGHLVGNLIATVAFGTVAEYAWGHFPRQRGSQSFATWPANPLYRILAVPAVAIAMGLFTAVFALGPVIGFSGVVYAFAGFALVHRPVAAVLALVGNQMLSLTITAVRNPQLVTVARPRVVTPWWAEIALQGHAIGLLAGVFVGAALAARRNDWPRPGHLWFSFLAFAVMQGLWALYLPMGGGRYVLFRWAGTAVVFLGTAVVVLAFAESDAEVGDVAALLRPTGTGPLLAGVPIFRRTAASSVLMVLLLSMSLAAVPYNVASIGSGPNPETTVEVRDYQVGYATDIRNGYVGAVSVPFFDDPTSVNESGVIVTSERRSVWRPAVIDARLKNRGRATVTVGGLGWREDVRINRTGWQVAGNDSVYKVFLRPEGENRTLGYTSEPRRAAPVVAGQNISVRAGGAAFELVVSEGDQTLGAVGVPANGSQASAGAITFEREAGTVYATSDGTRVAVAERET